MIIDPGCGFDERAKLIENVLKKEEVKRSTVVLTHAHPDHMGAARFLRANVLVHEIEVKYARDPRLLSEPFNIDLVRKILNIDFDLIEYFMGLCPIHPVDASPLPEKINFGDYVIKPILTPGHSPGHVALYLKREKLLFSGDLLGEIMAWYSPGGGGVEGYIESLTKLEGLNVEKVFPSHGDVTGIERVEEERRVLEERERRILKAIERGIKSREGLGRALFGEKWLFSRMCLFLKVIWQNLGGKAYTKFFSQRDMDVSQTKVSFFRERLCTHENRKTPRCLPVEDREVCPKVYARLYKYVVSTLF